MRTTEFTYLCVEHYTERQRAYARRRLALQALSIATAGVSLINLARVLGWLS